MAEQFVIDVSKPPPTWASVVMNGMPERLADLPVTNEHSVPMRTTPLSQIRSFTEFRPQAHSDPAAPPLKEFYLHPPPTKNYRIPKGTYTQGNVCDRYKDFRPRRFKPRFNSPPPSMPIPTNTWPCGHLPLMWPHQYQHIPPPPLPPQEQVWGRSLRRAYNEVESGVSAATPPAAAALPKISTLPDIDPELLLQMDGAQLSDSTRELQFLGPPLEPLPEEVDQSQIGVQLPRFDRPPPVLPAQSSTRQENCSLSFMRTLVPFCYHVAVPMQMAVPMQQEQPQLVDPRPPDALPEPKMQRTSASNLAAHVEAPPFQPTYQARPMTFEEFAAATSVSLGMFNQPNPSRNVRVSPRATPRNFELFEQLQWLPLAQTRQAWDPLAANRRDEDPTYRMPPPPPPGFEHVKPLPEGKRLLSTRARKLMGEHVKVVPHTDYPTPRPMSGPAVKLREQHHFTGFCDAPLSYHLAHLTVTNGSTGDGYHVCPAVEPQLVNGNKTQSRDDHARGSIHKPGVDHWEKPQRNGTHKEGCKKRDKRAHDVERKPLTLNKLAQNIFTSRNLARDNTEDDGNGGGSEDNNYTRNSSTTNGMGGPTDERRPPAEALQQRQFPQRQLQHKKFKQQKLQQQQQQQQQKQEPQQLQQEQKQEPQQQLQQEFKQQQLQLKQQLQQHLDQLLQENQQQLEHQHPKLDLEQLQLQLQQNEQHQDQLEQMLLKLQDQCQQQLEHQRLQQQQRQQMEHQPLQQQLPLPQQLQQDQSFQLNPLQQQLEQEQQQQRQQMEQPHLQQDDQLLLLKQNQHQLEKQQQQQLEYPHLQQQQQEHQQMEHQPHAQPQQQDQFFQLMQNQQQVKLQFQLQLQPQEQQESLQLKQQDCPQLDPLQLKQPQQLELQQQQQQLEDNYEDGELIFLFKRKP